MIAHAVGCPARTIRRELKRGWLLHRVAKYRVEERYSAGQEGYHAFEIGREAGERAVAGIPLPAYR